MIGNRGVDVDAGLREQRRADVTGEQRVAAAARCPSAVPGERPRTVEPDLVAGQLVRAQERVAVAGCAVTEPGALVERPGPPGRLRRREQQVLAASGRRASRRSPARRGTTGRASARCRRSGGQLTVAVVPDRVRAQHPLDERAQLVVVEMAAQRMDVAREAVRGAELRRCRSPPISRCVQSPSRSRLRERGSAAERRHPSSPAALAARIVAGRAPQHLPRRVALVRGDELGETVVVGARQREQARLAEEAGSPARPRSAPRGSAPSTSAASASRSSDEPSLRSAQMIPAAPR